MYVCHRGAPRRVGMFDQQPYGAVITDSCHAVYKIRSGPRTGAARAEAIRAGGTAPRTYAICARRIIHGGPRGAAVQQKI